jgi:hypothetical protein
MNSAKNVARLWSMQEMLCLFDKSAMRRLSNKRNGEMALGF